MKLVKPSLKYRRSFQNALKEFLKIDKRNEGDPARVEEYIIKCEQDEKGENLPEGMVPSSTFWLIDNNILIGRVRIRHKLNKDLHNFGGNIGYAIRPSKRRKGYGSKILELALKEARKLKLNRVLITCDEVNVASQKIIEKNGGKLWKKRIHEGKPVRLYWVSI